LVDVFIAPSAFLGDRYVAWGLPAAKMRVLENGQPRRAVSVLARDPGLKHRFVVLGQLSKLKCTISRIGPARFRVNGPTLDGLPAEPRFESSTRPFSLRQVFEL